MLTGMRRPAGRRPDAGAGDRFELQRVKRTACGFRNRERFRNAIIFHLGGFDLYPAQPQLPTRSPDAPDSAPAHTGSLQATFATIATAASRLPGQLSLRLQRARRRHFWRRRRPIATGTRTDQNVLRAAMEDVWSDFDAE